MGPCRGIYSRFAFDSVQGKCVPFVYGGCRGNQNNFFTIEECQTTCEHMSTPPTQAPRARRYRERQHQ